MEGHIKKGYNKQRAQEMTTWSSRHRSTDLVTLFWMSYSVLPLWEHLGLTNVLTSFPGDSVVKNTPAHAGDARDMGLIPGLGRSPGEGKGYSHHYSGLENSMDCMVHGVTNSWTWLSDFHVLSYFTNMEITTQWYYFFFCFFILHFPPVDLKL